MNRVLALSCQHHQRLAESSRRRARAAGISATAMMGRKKGVMEQEAVRMRFRLSRPLLS